MTQHSDQLRVGNAYFELQARWNGGNNAGFPLATSPQDSQVLGNPVTAQFYYQMGTASTALASGIFYSASGTATAAGNVFTSTGALVTASVATFDVPRGVRITSSVNLSTTTFTIVGTDGYGQPQTHQFVGPTGNTAGNVGSYTDSLVTFKTVTFASSNTATGVGTTLFMIGNNDLYGLPYVLNNVGGAIDVYINGSSASQPATFTAAYTPTGTPTASTTDVRGTVALATVVLSNGVRYFTVGMIVPSTNLSIVTDDKTRNYGAKPYTV